MRRAALLAILVALACAPAALAGGGGGWTPVTPDFDQSFNLAGLERTSDGVLHVAAQAHNAANPQHGDFIHVPISADGTVGNPTVISGDWAATNAPDIAAGPGGGLVAIWGGIHSTTTGDPLNNGTFATSDATGSAWTVDPVGPWPSGGTAGGSFVYGEQVSAQAAPDGTVFESWSHSGVYVHRGLSPTTPVSDFNQPIGGETTQVPDLAVDSAAGQVWLGWGNDLGSSGLGAWAQQVDSATGAPVGSPLLMPGSVTQFQGGSYGPSVLGRAPITGRPGHAGVWMAYPSGYPTETKLLVWKVGSSTSTTLADEPTGFRQVAITSDPDGRVIVAWVERNGGVGKLMVRVSNTDVTAWGKAFAIAPPKPASGTWALQASAQSGALVDLVGNFSEGTSGTPMRFWHTQVLAPPELAKSVDASVVSGQVLIKLPGAGGFVPLTHDSLIPVGATIDASRGRVRVVTALPGGRTQSADFFQGVFVVTQARTGLATMVLSGGSFAACGRAKRAASAAKVVEVRKLWGSGKGSFRTKGRYATASIRGTTWLTSDRCNGTLIRVTQGAVTVHDLVKKTNVVVTKGHSYLAHS